MNQACILFLLPLLLSISTPSVAQTTNQSDQTDPDPTVVLELGAEPGWSFNDHGANIGPTIAVELTPIENWLELELGVTRTFARHSREWNMDLLFKKPWTLSKKIEFMFGLGPEWIHTRESGLATNAVAGEVVLDFMFWPSDKRRFGWYAEPAYECAFGRSHERSASLTMGLLIGIGRRR